MKNKLFIEDLQVNGKRVLLRVDLNVPFNQDGTIADETRINASLPSIEYLSNNNAKTILISHRGRPKGQKKASYHLHQLQNPLKRNLKRKFYLLMTVSETQSKRQ